jgi:hypothetical protein
MAKIGYGRVSTRACMSTSPGPRQSSPGWADYALAEARPGGLFHLDIKDAPVRGRLLHLDPAHRLLISWGYAGSDRLPPGASTVEVRLTADRGGSRVELEHRDLPPANGPATPAAGPNTWPDSKPRPPAATPARTPACQTPRRQKTLRSLKPRRCHSQRDADTNYGAVKTAPEQPSCSLRQPPRPAITGAPNGGSRAPGADRRKSPSVI